MSPVPLDSLRRGHVVEAPKPGSHPARVYAFLEGHRAEAWRAHEVAAALDVDQHTIGAALRRLRARGLVDKEGPYWFALSEQESAQLQAANLATRDANERLGPEDPARWAHLDHE